jgi:hypothetical protein
MKRFLSIIALTILFCVPALRLNAAERLAFGYFINTTNNDEYDYLEEVFPKSIAGTMRNRYNFRTMSPHRIPAITERYTSTINKSEKIITDRDLAFLSEAFTADIFIYGTFTPVEKTNRVKMKISVHRFGSDTVFTFEDTGELGIEIFRLSDRVAMRLKNYIDKHTAYKLSAISKKSKVAILSNIEGDELNRCYYAFMKNGYRISPLHGNDIYSRLDDDSIKKMMTIEAANASLEFIADKKQLQLLHGTWSGVKYYKELLATRDTYNRFSFNFRKEMEQVLSKISTQDKELEYIIIIGFNDDHDTAWYRCIDIKNNRLMSFRSDIKGDTVDEVTQKIITDMTSPLAVIK